MQRRRAPPRPRRRRRPQRHQPARRRPRPARLPHPAARGPGRRHQPARLRRAALGGRLPHAPAAAARRHVNDSRPAAWDLTWDVSDKAVATAREWLAGELRQGEAVVVKDPRTVWFLPLWARAAQELGVAPTYVTMLRHPTEVVASARKSYGDWQSEASRTAAWLNIALETEHATRGERRAFVRYEDLLTGWQDEVTRVGELLDLPLLAAPCRPSASRRSTSSSTPPCTATGSAGTTSASPAPLRDLGERAWEQLQPLAEPGGDTPRRARHARCAPATTSARSTPRPRRSRSPRSARRGARAGAPAHASAASRRLRVRVARADPQAAPPAHPRRSLAAPHLTMPKISVVVPIYNVEQFLDAVPGVDRAPARRRPGGRDGQRRLHRRRPGDRRGVDAQGRPLQARS